MSYVNLHIARRVTQILFILLILFAPVLDIFRFDPDTRSLIFFGSEWDLGLKEGFYVDQSFNNMSHIAWQFFLKAILPWLGILAVFPIFGALTGRLFCGWSCPEGSLFELFDFLTLKILGRRSLFTKRPNDLEIQARRRIPYIILALLAMTALPLLFGVMLTGYFVNPRTVWSQVLTWEFTFGVKAGIVGVAIYIFISSIIVRHTLCKYVCSAGLMQMLFGWASPVSLRVRPDMYRLTECTDCKNCEKVCFMNVKPRMQRIDINCVNCGECIVACRNELGREKCVFSFSQSRFCAVPAKRSVDSRPETCFNVKNHFARKPL